MTKAAEEILMVPTAAISVLNPRARSKRIFEELVTSIAHLGLKKPITVSRQEDGLGYDLVCGQGRLEAFQVLGQAEIPAIVIDAQGDDRYVMSLVENLARRSHSSLELMREIGNLKERGYTTNEIALKVDLSPDYVSAICFLLEHGEERLVAAVERGQISPNVAIEIARAKDAQIQNALLEAYERKSLPGKQILTIRRIIELRNRHGKTESGSGLSGSSKVTAAALIRSYQREVERQKRLIRKAELTQARLLMVINALRRLLADEHFRTLMRAEDMHTVPRPLADRLHPMEA
jgi:ParB family chromosome partitioning protein